MQANHIISSYYKTVCDRMSNTVLPSHCIILWSWKWRL